MSPEASGSQSRQAGPRGRGHSSCLATCLLVDLLSNHRTHRPNSTDTDSMQASRSCSLDAIKSGTAPSLLTTQGKNMARTRREFLQQTTVGAAAAAALASAN